MTVHGYVVVHETKDAAQGEVLAELLQNEGIAARFRGPATTLVGVAKNAVAMAVEVPVEQEARARQFLRDLEGATGSTNAAAEADTDADADAAADADADEES